jgi:hypothetical protein
MHTDEGHEVDITDAVQRIYDAFTSTLDYGSGLLDYEDIAAIKRLAAAGGWLQPDYPETFCQNCHHGASNHRGRDGLISCWMRMDPGYVCGCEDWQAEQ